MLFLLLAILSSALISIIMRLSADRVTGRLTMLAANYLSCLLISAAFTGFGVLFPSHEALPHTIGLGVIHGMLYLGSFVLFQWNVVKNGIVLPAIFMKLGLLVPMIISMMLFGEVPSPPQWFGFFIAVISIVMINMDKQGTSAKGSGAGLLLLLIGGGAADAMSKIYEETGSDDLSAQFLFYTFLTAFLLCSCLVAIKKERIGRSELVFGLLIGIPNFFSARFLLLSLGELEAVIVYPTYSVATIMVVTLAGALIFKERLNRRQSIALGAILAALVLLNI